MSVSANESSQTLGWILIVIIVIIVIIGIIGIATGRNRTRVPVFLSKSQTRQFLLSDADNYISSFSPEDMFSRGFTRESNPSVYKNAIADAAGEFTKTEQKQLTQLAAQADAVIAAPRSQAARILGRKFANALADIPWKFAKTNGRVYENGMPHTRGDVIFLRGSNIPLDLLIHEKVHLFTRAFKKETQVILSHYGFSKYHDDSSLNHRANPDTTRDVYFHPLSGVISSQFYNTHPVHINHINTPLRYEHPYEWLAYLVGSASPGLYK